MSKSVSESGCNSDADSDKCDVWSESGSETGGKSDQVLDFSLESQKAGQMEGAFLTGC